MIEIQNNKDKTLKGVALVSLIFAMVVCILVIANYFQINRIDPVNSQVINALVDRLNDTPNDELLRQQIQELDLLARKAYFTNQWQIKMGGYLILLAMGVFVICYQLMDANFRKPVMANPDQPKGILGIQKNARVGIAIVGSGLLVFALFLAFFTSSSLELKLKENRQKNAVQLAEVEEGLYTDEKNMSPDSSTLVSENTSPLDSSALVSDQEAVEKTESEINEKSKDQEQAIKVEENIKTSNKDFPSAEELKRNFPSFRGYQSNGWVYQKNIPTEWDGASNKNILWKTELPLKGFNSPIIWENRVFLSGANESVREVFCFDSNTGALIWRTKIANIPGSPAVAPKTTADTGLAAATMTTDGKRVYVIFGTGDIAALDMAGKMVWGINLGVPQNHYGHSSSLIMYRNKLIVQLDQKTNSQILALNAATGEKIWSTPRAVKVSWSSPIMVDFEGKPQIITVADPLVAAYNPETGQEIWKLDCMSGEVGPSAAYADNKVFVLNEYATLAAIDLKKPGKVLWQDDMILSDIPSPVAGNDLLIVATSYGLVACYDAVSGEVHWEHEFNNNIYASPMVIGENVYVMDIKGNMYIFKLAKEFTQMGSSKLGEDAVATPAFADGRIFIRSNKHLFCIGK